MRLVYVLLLFLITATVSYTQQPVPQLESKALQDVLKLVETQYGVIFSYKDLNLKDEYIDLPTGDYTLSDLLDQIFRQTGLEANFITERHIIVTKKQVANEELGNLCGTIKDKLTNESLAFASIQLLGTSLGTYTDEQGHFYLPTTTQDTIQISYLGYTTRKIAVSQLSSSPCPTFFLETKQISLAPVIVKEYLTDGIRQAKTGSSIVINPKRLSVLPGSVEPDVMSSIQMLPGIFSADETASNINIRGGTPDQNLILYDGIPVYHTGHFFGMISAFNPYIIEAVDVYRSGIGTQYGGRVSGVIDIQSDKEVPKELTIGAGLNMTHGHLFSSFPLWKDAGLSFSVRRSITDSWPSPTFLSYSEKVFQGTKLEDGDFQNESVSVNDKFWFSDANLKWQWNPGNNKFGINVFGAKNNLDYSTDIPEWKAFALDVLSLNSEGFRIYWDRKWSEKFSSSLNLTSSRFDYNYNLSYRLTNDLDRVLHEYSSANNVTDSGFKLVNEWKPSENQRINFGYQFTENLIEINLARSGNNQMQAEVQNFENRVHALFGEYALSLQEVLDINFGLRFQRQTVLNNDYFEPRISANIHANDHLKLKVSTSKQFQFISQLVILNINDIGLSNQIWIASDNEGIPVIESNQWAAGLLYVNNDWTLDLEGYVKELVGITSLSNSFGTLPGQPFSQGNARIRGIDILLKKRHKSYRSWLSYTLSKALYEFPNLEDDAFPASHDQRHALQWVHIYEMGAWEFSAGWQIRSGLPVTTPAGVDIFENQMGTMIPFIEYGSTNADRMKAYHRLDASVMYHFGKPESFSGFVGLSFLNISNHSNLIGRQYLLDEIDRDMNQYEILEINKGGLKFTPNFVINIIW